MAVFSVPVEPAYGGGDAGRPRHLGDARDNPAMGALNSGENSPIASVGERLAVADVTGGAMAA